MARHKRGQLGAADIKCVPNFEDDQLPCRRRGDINPGRTWLNSLRVLEFSMSFGIIGLDIWCTPSAFMPERDNL
jgi:hypothetical protein